MRSSEHIIYAVVQYKGCRLTYTGLCTSSGCCGLLLLHAVSVGRKEPGCFRKGT